MLFKQKQLDGIKSGAISLAFRKWKKQSVKPGSLIKTAVGRIEVERVSAIDLSEITADDARRAGFDRFDDLLEILNSVAEGTVYKIAIRYHSADPRIQLREQKELSEAEFEILKTKLARLDQHSKHGFWTNEVLTIIRENPGRRAADLATLTGKEKEWLKLHIRKLKNLGLTISHETGYSIAPLGEAFLLRL
ncbi:hypothetical protein GCM10027347_02490 [Larkinella harenae]